MNRKKAGCIALCMALCATLLGGCGNEKDDAQVIESNGQYQQTDVTPPQLSGGRIESIRPAPDGKILAVLETKAGRPEAYLSADGESWDPVFPLNDTLAEEYPGYRMHYAVDEQGVWWVSVATVQNEDRHFFRIENGERQEIAVSMFTKDENGAVSGIFTGDDGTMLLCMEAGEQMVWSVYECATGSEASFFRSEGLAPSTLNYCGGRVYVLDAGGIICEYNAATGVQETSHQMPPGESTARWLGGWVDDGTFYSVNTGGLYSMDLKETAATSLCGNPAFAFADSTFRIGQLLPAGDGSLWLLGWEGGASRLYRYTPDENTPLATNSLTIWTLEENSFLQFALSAFARENPSCEITLEIGKMAGSGQTDKDIIRDLNTRLLAEDAPDVLILDGLPVEAMIHNEMLLDVSGLVEESEYYENILSSYTRGGKTYAYPALFWPVALLQQQVESKKPGMGDVQSLSALEKVISDPSRTYIGGYYHLFHTLYAAGAPAIFPGGTRLDKEALREFLSVTKAVVDAQGLSGQEYDTQYWIPEENTGVGGTAVIQLDPSFSHLIQNLRQGTVNAEYAIAVLYNYPTTLTASYDAQNRMGALFSPLPGNAFTPRCVAGLPAGTGNEKDGRAFIRNLLECQTVDNCRDTFFPGFFVKRDVEQQIMQEHYNEAKLEGNLGFPDPASFKMDALVENLQNASPTDCILLNKVYTQAKELYMGKRSMEETMSAIVQNTEMYFAERKQ